VQHEIETRLRELGGTPQDVLDSPELLNLFTPALLADSAIADDYVYQAADWKLTCPVVAIYSLHDKCAPRPAVAAWEAETTGRFCPHAVDCDHFGILSHPEKYLGILQRHIP
jgi:medium-chain acyl-[acyl-carrier-protein] hydrolase